MEKSGEYLKKHSPKNIFQKTIALGALLTAGFMATPEVAAAHPDKNKPAKPEKIIDYFDRTFTSDCANGVIVVEHLIGKETIRKFDNRQENKINVKGTVTDQNTGYSFKERQNFKIIFTEETVIFKGNLHTWDTPDGKVRQAGIREYAIEEGGQLELVKSSGPDDPYPNLCFALESGILAEHDK